MEKENWIRLFIGIVLIGLYYNADFISEKVVLIILSTFFILSKLRTDKKINQLQKTITEKSLQVDSIPSYKLDIYIKPRWFKLYKVARRENDDELISQEMEEKREKSENIDWNLDGRRYHFTEYYDASTGLTRKIQQNGFSSGKWISAPVDEFGDSGYFFYADSNLVILDDKKREERDKLSIEIGESYIRNSIFDKYNGGPRRDYKKEDYLFKFPLDEIFNFLLALGQRFHESERNTIIKWPDHIEKKFKDLGIKYETSFDYEPKIFDIERHDKDFFEKRGRPEIALHCEDKGILISEKDGTSFEVNLKLFRPGENERFKYE